MTGRRVASVAIGVVAAWAVEHSGGDVEGGALALVVAVVAAARVAAEVVRRCRHRGHPPRADRNVAGIEPVAAAVGLFGHVPGTGVEPRVEQFPMCLVQSQFQRVIVGQRREDVGNWRDPERCGVGIARPRRLIGVELVAEPLARVGELDGGHGVDAEGRQHRVGDPGVQLEQAPARVGAGEVRQGHFEVASWATRSRRVHRVGLDCRRCRARPVGRGVGQGVGHLGTHLLVVRCICGAVVGRRRCPRCRVWLGCVRGRRPGRRSCGRRAPERSGRSPSCGWGRGTWAARTTNRGCRRRAARAGDRGAVGGPNRGPFAWSSWTAGALSWAYR